MTTCSEGWNATIPCLILAWWALNGLKLTLNLLLSVLPTAAFYYTSLRPLISFLKWESRLCTHSTVQGEEWQGGACQWVWLPEVLALGSRAGMSRAASGQTWQDYAFASAVA